MEELHNNISVNENEDERGHEEHAKIPIEDITSMQIDLMVAMGKEKNEDASVWAVKYSELFRELVDEDPMRALDYHVANEEIKKEMLAEIRQLLEERFAQSVH